jgi:hypothetical protein
MVERSVAEEHQMACWSALCTVRSLGRATVEDVMRQQGLVEIRAKRALEDLVRDGKVRKEGGNYLPEDFSDHTPTTPLRLLLNTFDAPLAYCSCKEALLARCSAVLELSGVVTDSGFYERHLRVEGAGNTHDQAVDRYDQAWAEQVIRDAISQLLED